VSLSILITGDNEDNATNNNASQVIGSRTADKGPPYLDTNSINDGSNSDMKDVDKIAYENFELKDDAKDEVDNEDAEDEVEDEDDASINSAPIIVSEHPVDIDHLRPDLYSDSDENMDDSKVDDDTGSDPAPVPEYDLRLESCCHTQTPELNPSSSHGTERSTPELAISSPSEHEPPQDDIDREELEQVLESLGRPFVKKYPGGYAGMAHSIGKTTENQNYGAKMGERSQANPYAPFASSLEWQIAKWAKLRGPSSSAFTELIAIDGVS
jgi:hypothetical protein